jgi:predicted Zn-dependent protease with MMP-like domain
MNISISAFSDLVKDVLDELLADMDDELRFQAGTVLVYSADVPEHDRGGGNYHDLLGLFQGVPRPKRTVFASVPQPPDSITVFRRAHLRLCRNRAELRQEVRATLIHEFGHYFGFSERELADRGLS